MNKEQSGRRGLLPTSAADSLPSIRLHAFCGSHRMRGTRIAGLLIRQARLRRDWSQDGLCLGICTPLLPVQDRAGQGRASPEVTELLLRRLGLVWIPEPEDLKPCWNALLSGSPGFFLCYEQLVLPQQERLAFACSPLAADILLLAAFLHRYHAAPVGGMGAVFSTRQLALQRALQGRWDEAARLDPLPLLSSLHGKAPLHKGGSIQPPSRCCETPTARRQTQVIPT